MPIAASVMRRGSAQQFKEATRVYLEPQHL
jgi:hypothetical protein